MQLSAVADCVTADVICLRSGTCDHIESQVYIVAIAVRAAAGPTPLRAVTFLPIALLSVRTRLRCQCYPLVLEQPQFGWNAFAARVSDDTSRR